MSSSDPSLSVFMVSLHLRSQSSDIIKVPTAHYEFGANFFDPKVLSLLPQSYTFSETSLFTA